MSKFRNTMTRNDSDSNSGASTSTRATIFVLIYKLYEIMNKSTVVILFGIEKPFTKIKRITRNVSFQFSHFTKVP